MSKHPSFRKMITDTLIVLNQINTNQSYFSSIAIRNIMLVEYGLLNNKRTRKFLRFTLEKLVNEGKLLRKKNSYKFSALFSKIKKRIRKISKTSRIKKLSAKKPKKMVTVKKAKLESREGKAKKSVPKKLRLVGDSIVHVSSISTDSETDKRVELYRNFNDEKIEDFRIANFTEDIKDRTTYSGIDICFVLDVTSSMCSYIAGAKDSIQKIINDAKLSLEKLNAKESSLLFAIVAYRDHPPQDSTFVTKICDFTSSINAEKFLHELTASGGGDVPEAVLDGLHDAIYNVNWREKSEKFCFLIADAPPHGKRFVEGGDGFSNGCPCGFSEEIMLPKMKEMKIDFTVLKVNNTVEKMIEIFSKYINMDVFQPKIFRNNVGLFGKTITTTDTVTEIKSKLTNNLSTKVNRNIKEYITISLKS